MRTVGQILRETRENKLLTLENVEKTTKIRKELLQALEESDYSKLPPATFIQGFIKNYGKFLGLDASKLLAVFRRDFEGRKHPPVVLESFSKPISENRFRITPSRVVWLTLTLIILGFFTYLWLEYRQFVGSPNLAVTSPTEGQSVEIPAVMVAGNTDPDNKVLVNNQEIGVDKEGHFQEEIKLSSSANIVSVIATGKFGQMTKIDRTVFVRK
ncbi:helix-turn-helix domain-containing protein [Candidatus Daviesbacteria bacterium]|nr:helix-turn-helix domain-containing protein [Candidatus Daviesbacteria bacterium]